MDSITPRGGVFNPAYIGENWQLLWTNESPTSAFKAQTITLTGLSACDMVMVIGKYQASSTTSFYSYIGYFYENECEVDLACFGINSFVWTNRAFVFDRGEETVNIANGNRLAAAGHTEDAKYVIPLYILGAKL